MKGLLIPAAMALLGAGLGGGAATMLGQGADAEKAVPEEAGGAHAEAAEGHADDDHGGGEPADGHAKDGPATDGPADAGHGGAAPAKDGHGSGAGAGGDYVKLPNQFVVPVIEGGRTEALVVLSLGLDVAPGVREAAFAQEPKLRDALLRVMFDHANAGGFSGGFTAGEPLERLRAALRERARALLGPELRDVLILDIARQDA